MSTKRHVDNKETDKKTDKESDMRSYRGQTGTDITHILRTVGMRRVGH